MGSNTKKAEEYYLQGYNCAQSVFCSFPEVTGLTLEQAAGMSGTLGGGMGGMREVCGAVSGALMVLGAAGDYRRPKEPENKERAYALAQEFARRFKEKHGTIICRDLPRNKAFEGPGPEPFSEEYYELKPCAGYIRDAAQIVTELLAEMESAK